MHHQPVAPLTLTPFLLLLPLKAETSWDQEQKKIKKKNHWIHLFNSALLHPLSILLLFKVALALTDGSPTVPLSLIMYRGSSGSTGGRGGEDFGAACVWDGEESYEGAGVNYLPLARGSPAERQALTFWKGAIVCIQHSVMPHWSKWDTLQV